MNPGCVLYGVYAGESAETRAQPAARRLGRRHGVRREIGSAAPCACACSAARAGSAGATCAPPRSCVDSDILIDAGTGVGDLTLAELSQIDHIFITHSHLDHVASIPFLVDTVGGMRSKPLDGLRARAPPSRS